MPTATSFDGFAVNASTGYKLVLNPAGNEGEWASNPTLRPRLNQSPVLDATGFGERRIPFVIQLTSSAISADTFKQNVERYFSPLVTGTRTLLATREDGTTAMQAAATVTRLKEVGNAQRFIGEFMLPEPYWKSISTSTDSASPLTVAGNAKALPSIALTPNTTTLKRRRCTITEVTGRGLANYLYRITFDATGVSATASSNYIAFFQGRSVPFLVQTLNSAATTLDLRIDLPPSGSVYVDIYYGSSVANTLTNNKLDDGGMNLASGSFSNTNWVWDDFAIPNLIAATGSWRLVKMGNVVSGVSFGVVSYDSTSIKFGLHPSNQPALANDADGIAVVLGVEAGLTNALSGLSRDDVADALGVIAGNYNMKLAMRTAGSLTWTYPENWQGGAVRTTALDVDNAVELAYYIEPVDANALVNLELKASGTFQIALINTPTLTVGGAVTARIITGSLTNTTTGKSITFPTTFVDDVVLTIDAAGKQISAASGPIYNPPLPGDTDDWLYLAPGSNAWSDPSGAASSISWYERYAA